MQEVVTAFPNQFMADPVKTYLKLFMDQSITVVLPGGTTELTGTLILMSANVFVLEGTGVYDIFYFAWVKSVQVDSLEVPTALTLRM